MPWHHVIASQLVTKIYHMFDQVDTASRLKSVGIREKWKPFAPADVMKMRGETLAAVTMFWRT